MTSVYIEIDFQELGSGHVVTVDVHERSKQYISKCHMLKDELIQFRNMIHNLLLDLNLELNYE